MGKWIYYVEDDTSIRELVLYALKTAEFQVMGFENAASFTARLPLLPDEADRRKWQQGTRQSAAHGRQSDARYRIFADRVFRPSRTGAARRLSARFSDASRSRHPFHRPDPHDRQSGLRHRPLCQHVFQLRFYRYTARAEHLR